MSEEVSRNSKRNLLIKLYLMYEYRYLFTYYLKKKRFGVIETAIV